MQTTITWPHFPKEKIKAHKRLKTGPIIRGRTRTRTLIFWHLCHPTHDTMPLLCIKEGVLPALGGQGDAGRPRSSHERTHKDRTGVYPHRSRALASPSQVYMPFSSFTFPLSLLLWSQLLCTMAYSLPPPDFVSCQSFPIKCPSFLSTSISAQQGPIYL